MSSIPEELLYREILVRLPVKSLLACKCVCKNWYALISDLEFVKLHLTAQKSNPSLIYQNVRRKICNVNYDSLLLSSISQNESCDNVVELDCPFDSEDLHHVQLLASCNGLVLLLFYETDDLYDKGFLCLWNPATREYKRLPRSIHEDYEDHFGIYAFGYDTKIDDYKVYKTIDVEGSDTSLVDVYTLGLDSWKNIQTIPYSFYVETFFQRPAGVLVNGSLHWLGVMSNKNQFYDTIVSLDICNDRFEELKLPKKRQENDFRLFRNVGVLEGCLCVLTYVNAACYEVWVMQDYGVQESWTKLHVINHERMLDVYELRIVWSFNNGQILLQGSMGLFLYNSSTARVSKIAGMRVFYVENVAESLVSLNSRTFAGRKNQN